MSQYSQENTCVNNAKACNFIKKILQHRCFPVNIAEFLRTALCIEQLFWLLLDCIDENRRQLPHLEIRLNTFRRSTSPQNNSLCVVRCAVCVVHFKKREKHPWMSDTFNKVAGPYYSYFKLAKTPYYSYFVLTKTFST